MTEKYIMSVNNIPDGILHDQDLYNISYKDNVLTLSFETHLFSDQKGNELCEKYKNFTKCYINCKLEDEYFCSAELKTSLNKKNMYRVKSISIEEFTALANSEMEKQKENKCNPWEYLHIFVSPDIRQAVIELSIYVKYKGVKYSMCNLELNTNEIEFIWE